VIVAAGALGEDQEPGEQPGARSSRALRPSLSTKTRAGRRRKIPLFSYLRLFVSPVLAQALSFSKKISAPGGIRTPNPQIRSPARARSERYRDYSSQRKTRRQRTYEVVQVHVGSSQFGITWHHLKAKPWACRRRPLLDQASRSILRSSVDHPAPREALHRQLPGE
jgi:hypothetical protein